MRINEVSRIGLLTLGLSIVPAFGFDGTATPPSAKPPLTPRDAFLSGAQFPRCNTPLRKAMR
jgi:hypothetical protein